MTETDQKATGLTGGDKRQDDLRSPPQKHSDAAEGLERARKGPLDKNVGRNENPSHVPGNHE